MKTVMKNEWWSRIGIILVVSLTMNSNALGATVTWSNTGTGSWHTGGAGGNWGGAAVPTSADHASVANGGTTTISANAVASYISLGNTSALGGTGSLNMNASGYELSVKNQIRVGSTVSSVGNFSLSAGSVTAGSVVVGYNGTGGFTQNGGNVTASTAFIVGGSLTAATGKICTGVGTYTISGGTLLSTGTLSTGSGLRVGHGGAGAFNQSGGLVSVVRSANSSYNNGGIHIGDVSGGGDASYTMTGGTLDGGYLAGAGTDVGTVIRVGCNKIANAAFTLSGGDVYTTWMYVAEATGGSAVFDFNSGSIYTNAMLQEDPTIGGSVTWSGGTLHALSGDMYLYNQQAAVFKFDGNGATFDSTGADGLAHNIYVNTVMSGNYGFAKTGLGTMYLNNVNTYTGTTAVNGGVLALANASVLPTANSISVASGAGLAVCVGGTTTWTQSEISSVLSQATFASGAYWGMDTSNGDYSYSTDITGTLGFVKTGNNTLTLSGNNSYSSGTLLSGGTLSLGSASAIGSSGVITFRGGTLQFSSVNATDYSSRFSTADNQNFSLDTNGQSVTLASALTSSGGSLTKYGAGTLTLAAANAYTGTTTVSAGTLKLDFTQSASPAGNIINQASYLRLYGQTSLSLQGKNSTANSQTFSGVYLSDGPSTLNAVSGAGGQMNVNLGAISRNWGGLLNVNMPSSGTVTTTTANADYTAVGGSNTVMAGWVTVNGNTWAVSASDGTNSGAVTGLTNYNSTFTAAANVDAQTGTTAVGGGMTINSLRFNNAGAANVTVGDGSGNLTIANGGILVTSNVGANDITITCGTLGSQNGGTTAGGVGSVSSVLEVIQNNTLGTLTLNAAIDGDGETVGHAIGVDKFGDGTLIITGDKFTATGGTHVLKGTLIFKDCSTIGSSGLTTAANTTLGFNQTSVDCSYANEISGTGALLKSGSYGLTLSGDNTFSGGVTVEAGKLTAGAVNALGATTGAVTVNGSTAVLDIAGYSPTVGAVTLTSGSIIDSGATAGALTGASYAVQSGSINAILAGTGNLTKTGTGTVVLTGSNTYTGNTVVQAGMLKLGSAAQDAVLTLGGADVQSGTLAFDYTGGTSPAAAVKTVLASAYANGFASGQIYNSAATDSIGLGWTDDTDNSQVLVMSTYYGDSTLDGAVDENDLIKMLTNYGQSDMAWSQGDFTYDNKVDENDLIKMLTNYGGGISSLNVTGLNLDAAAINALNAAGIATVPEPSTIMMVVTLACSLGLWIARRKSRCK